MLDLIKYDNQFLDNNFLDNLFGGVVKYKTSNYLEPKINIYRTETGYKIQAIVPGVEKDNIELEVKENRILEISIKQVKEEKYKPIKEEHTIQNIKRSISFEKEIDPEQVLANLKNGILEIDLRLLENTISKRILIT